MKCVQRGVARSRHAGLCLKLPVWDGLRQNTLCVVSLFDPGNVLLFFHKLFFFFHSL